MKITLIKGNCLDSLCRLEFQSISMCLFDLPFNTTRNGWESAIDLRKLWGELLIPLQQFAPLVMFSKQPFTQALMNEFVYKHQWIWNKHEAGNFAVTKHQPLAVHEEINVFSMSGATVNYYPQMVTGKLRNKGGVSSQKNGLGFGGIKNVTVRNDQYHPKSILDFPSVPRRQRLHSAEKPVELLKYLIQTYSLPGETVLDVTFGSCSTGIAALESGRSFVGIEMDEHYFGVGVTRIEGWLRENPTANLQLEIL